MTVRMLYVMFVRLADWMVLDRWQVPDGLAATGGRVDDDGERAGDRDLLVTGAG